MAQAVLINVYEVPEGRDDEFLAVWEKASGLLLLIWRVPTRYDSPSNHE